MLFGHWLLDKPETAYLRAAWGGIIFMGLFLILRVAGGFGNIRPRVDGTWIDFLSLVKYPPSLTFTFFSMGINLGLLFLLSRAKGAVVNLLQPLVVLGQAPLFFYVTHLFLYLVMGMLFTPGGTNLSAMLPFWFLGLVILYPGTRWYASFKRRQSVKSVLRLL
jgi:hypothetical protein